MYVKVFQQYPGCIECTDGIVISPYDDNFAAAGILYFPEEAVVLLQRRIGRTTTIKYISGNDQYIDMLLIERKYQPVEVILVFFSTLVLFQSFSQVPVRSM